MKDAQQDVIEELRRDLFVARETADRCEERYHATRALVHVGVQKAEELELELTAHKEALEKCELVMRDIDSQVWSHCDVEEALAAIAKCKEGPTAADHFMEGQP